MLFKKRHKVKKPDVSVLADKKFLIVDDSDIAREINADVLSDVNAIVDMAADGVEALTLTDNHEYDYILLDLMMPGMDGLSTARILRGSGDNTKIIAVTFLKPEDAESQAKSAGIDAYIVKPLTLDKLIDAIAEIEDKQ